MNPPTHRRCPNDRRATACEQDFDDVIEAGLLHMILNPAVRSMLGAIRADLAAIDENTGDFNHRYLVIQRRCDDAGAR